MKKTYVHLVFCLFIFVSSSSRTPDLLASWMERNLSICSSWSLNSIAIHTLFDVLDIDVEIPENDFFSISGRANLLSFVMEELEGFVGNPMMMTLVDTMEARFPVFLLRTTICLTCRNS